MSPCMKYISRLKYQPLFGKRTCAPPPTLGVGGGGGGGGGGRESGGNRAKVEEPADWVQ